MGKREEPTQHSPAFAEKLCASVVSMILSWRYASMFRYEPCNIG